MPDQSPAIFFMPDNILNEAAIAFQKEWGIVLPETVSEEAILQALEQAVLSQLQKGPETFFQLMYRLDISEQKVNAALQTDSAPAKIARLIYERQLQKIQSRMQHRANNEDNDAELKW